MASNIKAIRNHVKLEDIVKDIVADLKSLGEQGLVKISVVFGKWIKENKGRSFMEGE